MMATQVNVRSLMLDEFSKFAHETAKYLRSRAGELETNMTKVMAESGKEYGITLDEGLKLGNLFEKSPRRAAALGLMSGMMLSRVMESRAARQGGYTGPENVTPETKRGKPTKSRKASKRKMTKVAEAA